MQLCGVAGIGAQSNSAAAIGALHGATSGGECKVVTPERGEGRVTVRREKVALLCGSYPPMRDGVGVWCRNLGDALTRSGSIDVLRIIPEQGNDAESESNGVRRVESWRHASSVAKVMAILRDWKPDVIQIEYPCMGYGKSLAINLLSFAIRVSKLAPIVVTLHEFASFTWLGRIRAMALVLCSQRVVVTDKLNQLIITRLTGICPVLVPVPPQVPVHSASRRRFADIRPSLHLGYWGYVLPGKGLELLLGALRIISERSSVKLHVFADLDESNSYHRHLLGVIRSTGLSEIVVIEGYVPDEAIAQRLGDMDVIVLPYLDGVSDRRGTFTAAMATGLPVVTTLREEALMPDGLRDRFNVILARPSVNELVVALEYCLAHPGKCREIGNAAREWALSRTWSSVALEYRKVYASISQFRGGAK